MLPMPMVESLTASPVDSMTLDAAFPRLPTTFSSRSPTTFKVSWIAPPIALIMELPPCATDSKVAPRALQFTVMCPHTVRTILQWGEPKHSEKLCLAATIKRFQVENWYCARLRLCRWEPQHKDAYQYQSKWAMTSPSYWCSFRQNFSHEHFISWYWLLQWSLLEILLNKGKWQVVFWLLCVFSSLSNPTI